MPLPFDRIVKADLGSEVRFSARSYPSTSLTPARAQVSVDTGAANVTFYPTPEALEALAGDLIALAVVVRELRERVAA